MVSHYSVFASVVLVGTLIFCVTKYASVSPSQYLRASKVAASIPSVSFVADVVAPAAVTLTSFIGLEMTSQDDDHVELKFAPSTFRQHGQLENYMSENLVMGVSQRSGEENFAVFVGSLIVSGTLCYSGFTTLLISLCLL